MGFNVKQKNTFFCFILLIIWSIFFLNCAGMREGASPVDERYAKSGEVAYEEESLSIDETGKAEPDTETAALLSEETQEPKERLRIYTGFTELIVDKVDESKRSIMQIAQQSGGYVESVQENSIIIRVPAARFFDIFQQVLSLGQVHSKSIESIDVTEYYQDISTRLQVAEITRARLYKLLDKTTDTEERVKILQEIRRLTEEIEKLKLTQELLEQQIAFSRIIIQLIPRLAQQVFSRDEIPFYWIAILDPLYPRLDNYYKEIEFSLDDDFAVFSRENRLRTETADGIRVRISATANNPEGDSLFWQRALDFHLGKFYKSTEKYDFNQVKAVLFESKDAKPFYYLVGVYIDKDTIFVIEAFFPDSAARQAKFNSVKQAIENFKVK
jgi:hypothetical protein